MKKTAKTAATKTRTPDLRAKHDESIAVADGTLYRRGLIVQVWWDKNADGESFDNSKGSTRNGCETWTYEDMENAIANYKCMSERWNTKTPKARKTKTTKPVFTGTIEASTLYSKQLPHKNTDAVAYAAVNDKTGTVQYFNTYGGHLTAGYRADVYTFSLNDKTIKKLEGEWVEVVHHEWPSFCTMTWKPLTDKPATKRRKVTVK